MKMSTIILFYVLALSASAQQGLVVPANLANVEGNSALDTPFLPYTRTTFDPIRFQQVYSASEFMSILPHGGWISEIHFRGNAPSDGTRPGAIVTDLPDIQINFSTTSRTIDGLSARYSDNVGGDDIVAFARGPLSDFHIGTPRIFTGQIFLSNPFFYDPRAGNLLMDVRTYAGIPFPFSTPYADMDAQDTIGDSISSVSGSLSSDVGSLSTMGLVTRIVVMPVPEPSFSVLLGLGIIALTYTAWRNRNPNL
jgi:hypothetical protein